MRVPRLRDAFGLMLIMLIVLAVPNFCVKADDVEFIAECRPLWGQENNAPEYSKVDFFAFELQGGEIKLHIDDMTYPCTQLNKSIHISYHMCGENEDMELSHLRDSGETIFGGRGFKCQFWKPVELNL